MTVYYHGCIGKPGHYLYDTDGRMSLPAHAWPKSPWRDVDLDGTLAPQSTRREGKARLHHQDGWTALAFHDYTVDSRTGSNSVFLVDEPDLDVDDVWALAAGTFPSVIDRLVKAEVKIQVVAE